MLGISCVISLFLYTLGLCAHQIVYANKVIYGECLFLFIWIPGSHFITLLVWSLERLEPGWLKSVVRLQHACLHDDSGDHGDHPRQQQGLEELACLAVPCVVTRCWENEVPSTQLLWKRLLEARIWWLPTPLCVFGFKYLKISGDLSYWSLN